LLFSSVGRALGDFVEDSICRPNELAAETSEEIEGESVGSNVSCNEVLER